MIKAVIFDMDGVIIDSEPVFLSVELALYKQLGLPLTKEDHDVFVGTSSKNMWAYLKERFGIEQEVSELVKAERELLRSSLLSQENIGPIPGITELITDLNENGIKLAIASSSSIEEIGTVIDLFNIRDFFSQLVSGDEVYEGKPAPDIFLLAAKRLEVEPFECLVIEDSKNGVEAAKTAGMKCIGYRNASTGEQDLSQADLVIDSFLGLTYSLIRD